MRGGTRCSSPTRSSARAFDSRLVRNIREEKGYTYSPQSIFQAMGQGGLYRAVADVRNDVTGATLKEIYAEIDKMRGGGPEAEELSDAKQYSRGLFVHPERHADRPCQHAQHGEHFGLPKDYPETFQRQISQPSAEAVKTGAQMLLGSRGLGGRDRRRLHQGQGSAGRASRTSRSSI